MKPVVVDLARSGMLVRSRLQRSDRDNLCSEAPNPPLSKRSKASLAKASMVTVLVNGMDSSRLESRTQARRVFPLPMGRKSPSRETAENGSSDNQAPLRWNRFGTLERRAARPATIAEAEIEFRLARLVRGPEIE